MTEVNGVGWTDGVVRSAVPGGDMSAGIGSIVSPQRAWVGIVANPSSGRGAGRRGVEHLSRELAGRNLEARVAWTLDERVGLVTESASDPGCRCLVAAGGDGTVADLVNE